MTSNRSKKYMLTIFMIGAVAAIGWIIAVKFQDPTASDKQGRKKQPVPVEVAPIQRGPIVSQRTFSGELEAPAKFVLAPKVSGRVERISVDIADTVNRGQLVAELDNEEYVQEVAQAQADLLVAGATLSEAKSALEVAEREFKRTESLLQRGIASDSDFDASRQDLLVKQAQLKVAEARIAKARSSLETARIRLGYTKITAGWSGGDDQRVVAERYVDEGQTVAANEPLLLIVELDPIMGVIFVTERDYANLEPGQPVSLTTDAFTGKQFQGQIARIAPIFRKSTRQARIEITAANPQHRLKPGMFIQATVTLARVSEATIVPEQALTVRNDQSGIFIVSEDGRSVVWREVTVGIRDGNRLQVTGGQLSGRVVTLGQQLVDDGSPITISGEWKHTGLSSQKVESP